MRIHMAKIIVFAFGGLLVFVWLAGCSSQTQSTQGSLVDVTVKEIALMPFLAANGISRRSHCHCLSAS